MHACCTGADNKEHPTCTYMPDTTSPFPWRKSQQKVTCITQGTRNKQNWKSICSSFFFLVVIHESVRQMANTSTSGYYLIWMLWLMLIAWWFGRRLFGCLMRLLLSWLSGSRVSNARSGNWGRMIGLVKRIGLVSFIENHHSLWK